MSRHEQTGLDLKPEPKKTYAVAKGDAESAASMGSVTVNATVGSRADAGKLSTHAGSRPWEIIEWE